MKKIFVLAATLVLACAQAPSVFAASPDVILHDPQGQTHHFNEYVGRVSQDRIERLIAQSDAELAL